MGFFQERRAGPHGDFRLPGSAAGAPGKLEAGALASPEESAARRLTRTDAAPHSTLWAFRLQDRMSAIRAAKARK
jgi:hypothetical protein